MIDRASLMKYWGIKAEILKLIQKVNEYDLSYEEEEEEGGEKDREGE